MTYTYTTRYALPYPILRYRIVPAIPKHAGWDTFNAEIREHKRLSRQMHAYARRKWPT